MTLLSAVAAVELTPFDAYLEQQSAMTAVDRFSRQHEADLEHHQARYYRDLIPLALPAAGQQYGFEVDLDSCTGCKACVAACHSLNGLDDDESWRTVAVMRSEPGVAVHQQTVTSACHHCVDPACLAGCPVDAYEKDPITGIVSHLDDQCIGCSYCTLACPYEVPVYNHARGIVRKCDMCKDRLVAGEAPACVQGCPNAAIRIRIVDVATMKKTALVRGAAVVAGAPPSSFTVPTSRYVTTRPDDPSMSYARFAATERPADRHTPLAVTLVLTQLSVGAFVIDQLARLAPGIHIAGGSRTFDAILAVVAGVVALGASIFHLGRPRYAYRAVIGLRHSWLSREVVAFGGFTTLATGYAMALAFGWPIGRGALATLAGVGAAAFGLLGIGCSVMIYATVHRASWRAARSVPMFGATTVICGLAAVLWASVVSSFAEPGGGAYAAPSRGWFVLLALLLTAKLVGEGLVFRHLGAYAARSDRARIAHLIEQQLRGVATVRFAAGLSGVVLILVAAAHGAGPSGWLDVVLATLALGAVTVGELFERSLFFSTASRPQ